MTYYQIITQSTPSSIVIGLGDSGMIGGGSKRRPDDYVAKIRAVCAPSTGTTYDWQGDTFTFVSPRCKEALEQLNIPDIQFIPTTSEEACLATFEIFILNSWAPYPVIHDEASEIDRSRRGRIIYVTKLVLDGQAIENLNLGDGPRLFCPEGTDAINIINEPMKQAMEAANLTGYILQELPLE